MATNKEKQLATILLKERIERLTGKKVVLKEYTERDLQRVKNDPVVIKCQQAYNDIAESFGVEGIKDITLIDDLLPMTGIFSIAQQASQEDIDHLVEIMKQAGV
jgi:hypothetical protein